MNLLYLVFLDSDLNFKLHSTSTVEHGEIFLQEKFIKEEK